MRAFTSIVVVFVLLLTGCGGGGGNGGGGTVAARSFSGVLRGKTEAGMSTPGYLTGSIDRSGRITMNVRDINNDILVQVEGKVDESRTVSVSVAGGLFSFTGKDTLGHLEGRWINTANGSAGTWYASYEEVASNSISKLTSSTGPVFA
jgi:hypothetical protein